MKVITHSVLFITASLTLATAALAEPGADAMKINQGRGRAAAQISKAQYDQYVRQLQIEKLEREQGAAKRAEGLKQFRQNLDGVKDGVSTVVSLLKIFQRR